jgi:hypothetical protein
LSNSAAGQVTDETIFHYRQKGQTVWATYEGGEIRFGTLSGERVGNNLNFQYQHQDSNGHFRRGKCSSVIKIHDGKIHLYETWQWSDQAAEKGTSELIEIIDISA